MDNKEYIWYKAEKTLEIREDSKTVIVISCSKVEWYSHYAKLLYNGVNTANLWMDREEVKEQWKEVE